MRANKTIKILMCSLSLATIISSSALAMPLSSSPSLFHHEDNNCFLQFGYSDDGPRDAGVAIYGLWMGCDFGDETVSFLLDFAVSPGHIKTSGNSTLAGFTHLAMGLKVVPYQTGKGDLGQFGFSLFTKGFSSLLLFEEDELTVFAGAEVGLSLGYNNEMNFFGKKLYAFIEPFYSYLPAHFAKYIDTDAPEQLVHNLMRFGITLQATWEKNPTPLVISSSALVDTDGNFTGWHNGIGISF